METTTLIDNYLDGPQLLRKAVAGMSQEQLVARPIPGKWSTLEVICHLADFEIVGADRIKRVIAENEPTLSAATRSYLPPAWPTTAECRRGTPADRDDPQAGGPDSSHAEARGFPTPGHPFGGRASDAGSIRSAKHQPHSAPCSVH